MTGPAKTILMLSSIALGLLIPQAESLSFLIRYFLMGMLFFAFLDVEFNKNLFTVKHLFVVLFPIGLSLILYYLVSFIDKTLALALFVTAIAPSAISSAPIIGYLKGNVGYVTLCVLITNVAIALIIPFILPLVVEAEANISLSRLLFPVLSVMFIPLALAVITKRFIKPAYRFFKSVQLLSFFFFIANIFLAMSSARNFISTEFVGSYNLLILIAIGIALLATINFSSGWLIGGKTFARETSNSIGQKNTMFAIWISLTFINPLVALGPMMYTIFHNLFVSYQLYSSEK